MLITLTMLRNRALWYHPVSTAFTTWGALSLCLRWVLPLPVGAAGCAATSCSCLCITPACILEGALGTFFHTCCTKYATFPIEGVGAYLKTFSLYVKLISDMTGVPHGKISFFLLTLFSFYKSFGLADDNTTHLMKNDDPWAKNLMWHPSA